MADASSEKTWPTLLAAKTRVPPSRRGLIHRDDLVRRLAAGNEQKLVIVNAPAGYGKSTLLQQWATGDGERRFSWVQLDPSDNDPVMFWRYVLAAIRVQFPGLAESAWQMLIGPAPDIDLALTEILNALDTPEQLVLVLDDFHVIDNPDCHRTFELFVGHLPPNVQVAVATRARLPFSVARLQAHRLVTEVQQRDLAFSNDETEQAVRLVSPNATNEEISHLFDRTEGWPVGVYLSISNFGIAPTTPADAPEHSEIARNYILDEMLRHLGDDDLDFVRDTSILEWLTAELCDHVTDRTDSITILDRLASRSLLLIPLDERGDSYRHHHLLGEVLSSELDANTPDRKSMLHARAGDWYALHGDPSLAIHHAIEAGRLDVAGDLICAHWSEYVFSGRFETVNRWLIHFPDESVVDHPPLIVASAWIAAFGGDTQETRRRATEARAARYAGDPPDGTQSYESSVALLLAGLGLDGVTDALDHATTAYRLEPPDGTWRPMAAVLKGTGLAALGEVADARTALLEASETPGGPDGLATYALGQLSLLEASVGHWEAASAYADRAQEVIDEFGLQNLLSSGAAYTALAAVKAHRRDAAGARRQLQSLAPLLSSLSDAVPFDSLQIHLVTAEVYASIGKRDAARVHARAASRSLATLGDGGVLADRLDALIGQLQDTNKDASEQSPVNPTALTERELQILALLMTALPLREIGQRLYVSRNTIKTHVAHIYRKLGVTDRTAAIARGHELELI